MEPVMLSAEDLAILELEGETVAGHTCKVIRLAAPAPSVDELRASIAGRLPRAPMMTCRLGRHEGGPAWVADRPLALEEHVTEAAPEPLSDAEIAGTVAELFERRLDRDRPLWQIDRLELADGAAALVWRIHHALADGMTAMRLARDLLWDPEPGDEAAPRAGGAGAASEQGRHGLGDAALAARPAHVASVLLRELAPAASASPFDREVGRRRAVSLASVDLRRLHDAAHRLAGASVNDAVLATVAGALRRWLTAHGAELGELRAKVPVSLHEPGEARGNRDSFLSVPLPIGEPDPVSRLRLVHGRTEVRKAEHDAQALDQLMRSLAAHARPLAELCERIERSSRAFAVNVSNVPGPREPVSILGVPVESMHSIAEIGEHHALRIAVVSLGERLGFGLCADPAVVGDLDALARGLELEAAELYAAAAGHARR